MCNAACLEFGARHLSSADAAGRFVLEVGSRDLNGSLRPMVEALGPGRYVGVDIAPGLGVDELCDATEVVARFGEEAFDLVISTELIEHVLEWRTVVSNLKRVLRINGVLLLTTRSRGFGYHGFPHDYWRYEADDVRAVFGDMRIEALETDRLAPGVFLRARKPAAFREADLASYELFSVLTGRRVRTVTDEDLRGYLRRTFVRRVLVTAALRPVPATWKAWVKSRLRAVLAP